MSASLRFSVTYVCDTCAATAPGVEYESSLYDGFEVPRPTLPETWTERRSAASREHFCSAACELRRLAGGRASAPGA